jgi:hypothetical protein
VWRIKHERSPDFGLFARLKAIVAPGRGVKEAPRSFNLPFRTAESILCIKSGELYNIQMTDGDRFWAVDSWSRRSAPSLRQQGVISHRDGAVASVIVRSTKAPQSATFGLVNAVWHFTNIIGATVYWIDPER